MDPREVAVREFVPGLGVLGRLVIDGEVPVRVFIPAVRFDELVFLACGRLVLAPVVALIQDHVPVTDLVFRERVRALVSLAVMSLRPVVSIRHSTLLPGDAWRRRCPPAAGRSPRSPRGPPRGLNPARLRTCPTSGHPDLRGRGESARTHSARRGPSNRRPIRGGQPSGSSRGSAGPARPTSSPRSGCRAFPLLPRAGRTGR